MLTAAGFGLCALVGWYAAVVAFRAWVTGEHNKFLLTPPGALLVLALGGAGFLVFALSGRTPGEVSIEMIPMLLMLPAAVLPYGAYVALLLVEVGGKWFALSTQGEHRSYDRGDAAMARHEYELAVQCYRADLARWPGDFDATLRLGRALESAGEPQAAAGTLNAIRFVLLETPSGDGEALARPALSGQGNRRRDRGERILALTYALGDLYAGPLGEPHRAKALYEETLQKLYGYPHVDPLRERLRMLSEGGAEPRSPENIAPARLSLD